MKKRFKKENGLLTLEACMSLTIFIFMMLFLYSFFIMFEVRNDMAHVTLATANSLSLDAIENSGLGESGNISQALFAIYGAVTDGDTQFTDFRQWHTPVENEDGTTSMSASFSGAIKDRFLAYLTDGDLSKADQILKRYHVAGGVDGLDFSESKVEGKNLYIVVKYTVEYEFNPFGLGTVKMKQSACSRIWQ